MAQLSRMTKIVMYGANWCGDTIRSKQYLEAHQVNYKYVDLVAHPEEKEVAKEISGSYRIPVLVFEDGSFLSEPSNAEIKAKL